MAKIKSKKTKPSGYNIPVEPSHAPLPTKDGPSETTGTKEHKKNADKTKSEWLDKKTKNPYVKFKRSLLKKVDPVNHSIWIKYIKKEDGKRCSGGMIVQNHTPKYVKLRNPYSHAEFSVQLKDITVYTRQTNLKDMKKVR